MKKRAFPPTRWNLQRMLYFLCHLGVALLGGKKMSLKNKRTYQFQDDVKKQQPTFRKARFPTLNCKQDIVIS